MSAALCACTFPQPPNETGATFLDELGDPLGPATGVTNGVLLFLFAAAVLGTVVRFWG
jgi:hypothetical protein